MAASLNPWPTTRQGSKEHQVTTLQYLLQAHGHTVTVDGVFGAQTGDAVRAYQRAKDLPDDGVVGPDTWQALLVEVRPGSKGSAVRGLQREFRLGTGADGVYGPMTEQAVRAFQQDAHLLVDGVVGPRTWRAIVSGAPAQLTSAA